MDCQIIHDSIHDRPGGTIEYGPWTTSHALYELYIKRDFRRRIFDLFAALLAAQCKLNPIGWNR